MTQLIKLGINKISDLEYPDELVTKAAVSLRNGSTSTDNNKIFYESSDYGIVNSLVPVNSAAYTAKQLQSTMGEVLPWYFELATSIYPVTEFFPAAGTQTRYLSTFTPNLFTENGPYDNAHMINYYGGYAPAANKFRYHLTLPVGNYRIKILHTTNGTTINETNRLATWFKIIANGVDYGLDHMFEAGSNTQNNPQWVRTIDFTVSSASTANVTLAFWSTVSGGHVGLNMFEITKLD